MNFYFMTGNKSQEDSSSRSVVLANMTYLLSYLGANMGVSREMILGMITEVGNNCDTVGRYLRNIKSRKKHQERVL